VTVEFGEILSPHCTDHHDYSSSDDDDDTVLNDSSGSKDGWGTEREQPAKRACKVRPLVFVYFLFSNR